jgi:hypothetical protein
MKRLENRAWQQGDPCKILPLLWTVSTPRLASHKEERNSPQEWDSKENQRPNRLSRGWEIKTAQLDQSDYDKNQPG